MHELADAIDEAIALYPRLSSERVGLADSFGRRLDGDIVARRSVPPFDASAMDGFAVRAEDLHAATTAAPVELRVAFEVRAGADVERAVGAREAARILTGGVVPRGADAVVAQEDTTQEGERLFVRVSPAVRAHIRDLGSDVRAGELLLARGARIDAGAVALLASEEVASPRVVRRPIVAILPTGDELRSIGEPDRPGSIVDSNAPMLASLVAREGGIPRVLPSVRDDLAAIVAALADAADADVVLTTGGVSVGDHDHVAAAFEHLGVAIRVRKVRMKPGKPVTVGTREGRPFVGLPGNPASAAVGFELFVAPGLRRMAGDETPFPEGESLPLVSAHRRSPGRPELARARIVVDEGVRWVSLARSQGSASLRSIAGSDALVLFGAETRELSSGSHVFTWPLGAPGRLGASPFRGRPELMQRTNA